jgi:hypothetical protein
MTTPEQLPAKRRRQIFEDEPKEPHEPDTAKHEDSWVRDFIGRFAGAVRNIGGKR